MKLQHHLAGMAVIAVLVAGTLLAAGSWFSSWAAPAQQVEIAALPSDGDFQINRPIAGRVEMAYSASGELTEDLQAPTAEELAEMPDLDTVDLAFLLNKGSGPAVTGYVDLGTTLVFTGYHTIDTTLAGKENTLTVGPKVSGTYQNGLLNLLSERVSYTTGTGQTVERQFRLAGVASQTPGILKGEYRETIWGYTLEPLTIVGSFELKDLQVTLVKNDTNAAPTANALNLATTRNKAVAAKLSGSDPEGGALSFAVVGQPINGSLSGTAPNLTYTPKKDFTGIDSFTYKVNDGGKDSDAVAVTIKVTTPPATNVAPVANPQTVKVVQGKAKAITLIGSDANGDPLTFVVVTQPANGKLSGAASHLTYTPNGSFIGNDSFTFKVNDGAKDSETVVVTIKVSAPPVTNLPPVANGQAVQVVQGQAKSITLSGSDANGDSLSFVVVTQPAKGKLSGSAPNLTYTPNAGFNGKDSFTFKVNDGKVDSPSATVSINVKAPAAVNHPPTASGQSLATAVGRAIAITLNGVDGDGDSVSFIIVAEPAHGELSGSAPNLTYTPEAGFAGSDGFSYKVNDGEADSPVVTVTIVVKQAETALYLPLTVTAGNAATASTVTDAATVTETAAPAEEDALPGGSVLYLPIMTR